MEFKGTKGSWKVIDDYENDRTLKIWNGDEQAHGAIMQTEELGDMNYYEAMCNAKLIAAAPELLSAVEEAITGLEWKKENQPTLFDKADDEKLFEWKELVDKIL